MIRLLPRRAAALAIACLLYGAPAVLASDATPPAAAVATTSAVPHLALLLPLNSKTFGRHAQALRAGFQAAAQAGGPKPPSLPVREYAVADEVAGVLQAYRTAVAAGAQLVVGPLTRDAVTALAFGEPVPVPTLALNVPDNVGRMPGNLYLLSLQVESEARQVARLAWRDGRRKAATVSSSSPLHRRLQSAFAGEFQRLGGAVVTDAAQGTEPEKLKAALRNSTADMYFLALGHAEARAARPYLGNIPLYATSSVHAGDQGALAGFDLNGVKFIDMPWLLDPNHAAVMVYPRPAQRGSAEFERLYALGIDAWRVAGLLLGGSRDLRLDGVTGQLALGAEGYIERELVSGRYADGRPRLEEQAAREPAR